ncbi:MAG: cardiolipin synthase [Bacilli bacterium]|nr:cardiolipin synthase [Bacilli bacterium]
MKNKQVKSNFISWLIQFPFKIIFSRFTLAFLMLVIQGAVIYFCTAFFQKYLLWLFGGVAVLGIILTIYIINQTDSPAFQISWIILILLFPALGVFVYLFVKLQIGVHSLSKKYQKLKLEMETYQKQDLKVYQKLQAENIAESNYVTYMNRLSGYSIYQNTISKYYALGDEMYPDLLHDLENAKEYIFLEYFIVAKGKMWNSILEILKKKVSEGVNVKFMYDGTCSFMLLPHDYPKYLESYGIECKVFNPVVPIISTQYNNRDHRKIVVVDGKIAYTGGVNLADEYINELSRFGHWKDTAIRLEGEAVRGFILMFLENWYVEHRGKKEYQKYLNGIESRNGKGYILPFGDNPFDHYLVGEDTYLHILHQATQYVHIIMPYLIIDHEMMNALRNASQRGVDVKLIMPKIPDKPFIYYMAKTFYRPLMEAGVQIYEYTPGFTHAKMFVSDDVRGVVGTINLDYRSLYLHFEDAVYLYQDQSVLKIEEDIQDTLEKCELVTIEALNNYSKVKLLIGKLLRVFAPLL